MREPITNLIDPMGLQISVRVAQLNRFEGPAPVQQLECSLKIELSTLRRPWRERGRERSILLQILVPHIHSYMMFPPFFFLYRCVSSLLGSLGQGTCPKGPAWANSLLANPRWHTTRWWPFFRMKVSGKGPCFALEMLSSQVAGLSTPTAQWEYNEHNMPHHVAGVAFERFGVNQPVHTMQLQTHQLGFTWVC